MRAPAVIGCVIAAAVITGGATYAVTAYLHNEDSKGACAELLYRSRIVDMAAPEARGKQFWDYPEDQASADAEGRAIDRLVEARRQLTPSEAADCAVAYPDAG